MREFGSGDVSGRVSTYLVDPFGRYVYVIGDFGMLLTNSIEVTDVEVFANSLQFGRVNKIRVVYTWGFVGLKLIPEKRCRLWLLANSLILKAGNEKETVFEGFIYRRTASSRQRCSNLGNCRAPFDRPQ